MILIFQYYLKQMEQQGDLFSKLALFDNIPEELWESIFVNLACKDVIALCRTSERLCDYCKRNNIQGKVRKNGYPRIEGHCGVHDVSMFTDITDISNLTSILYDSLGINMDDLQEKSTLMLEAKHKLNVILCEVLNRLCE